MSQSKARRAEEFLDRYFELSWTFRERDCACFSETYKFWRNLDKNSKCSQHAVEHFFSHSILSLIFDSPYLAPISHGTGEKDNKGSAPRDAQSGHPPPIACMCAHFCPLSPAHQSIDKFWIPAIAKTCTAFLSDSVHVAFIYRFS